MDAVPGVWVSDFVVAVAASAGSVLVPVVAAAVVVRTLLDAAVEWRATIDAIWTLLLPSIERLVDPCCVAVVVVAVDFVPAFVCCVFDCFPAWRE